MLHGSAGCGALSGRLALRVGCNRLRKLQRARNAVASLAASQGARKASTNPAKVDGSQRCICFRSGPVCELCCAGFDWASARGERQTSEVPAALPGCTEAHKAQAASQTSSVHTNPVLAGDSGGAAWRRLPGSCPDRCPAALAWARWVARTPPIRPTACPACHGTRGTRQPPMQAKACPSGGWWTVLLLWRLTLAGCCRASPSAPASDPAAQPWWPWPLRAVPPPCAGPWPGARSA